MVTRIVVSLVLAPLFLAVLLLAPIPVVAVMVSGIVALAAYELLRATGAGRRKGISIVTALAAALIPVCYWQEADGWAVRLVLVALLCALFFTAVLMAASCILR